ncbi:MAG: hypothetical protein ACJA2S_003891 [Cyclobacteriaceae bacterium]|jgi:hypothetical protein
MRGITKQFLAAIPILAAVHSIILDRIEPAKTNYKQVLDHQENQVSLLKLVVKTALML